MKKLLALALAVLMCVALAACGGTPAASSTPAPAPAGDSTPAPDSGTPAVETPADSEFSGDVTLKVMLMPQGDMNSDTVAKVTNAVNARIAELGHEFKVEFLWSGGAWAFLDQNTALQTGAAVDIVPAHSWSGSVTYMVGAQNGQYLRLDNPDNNLLEKYGPDLYGKTAAAIKAAATIPGDEGTGIYGYIIEKDSVSQLGYLVNKTLLEELGFTMADFKADDFASWKPLLEAAKAANPNSYPLNVEAEVLDRTVNHVAYIDNTVGALGIVFDNANPGGTNVAITSRYENPSYKNFLSIVRDYFNSKFIDPDQGLPGEVSSASTTKKRTEGDFLISTFVYAPGSENVFSLSATEAQGKPIELVWAPGWSVPIATTESAMGAGLAVYAGTKYAPEAVTFLNMMASDTVIGNLVSEGVEGESYEMKDGIAWRIGDRAGWSIWRYGVVGATSAATPLGDVDATGNEWVNFRNFNSNAAALSSTGWVFDVSKVDSQNSACIATIDKYAVPLGSGALDPAQYDAFISELKAVGVDAVVAEAQSQYSAWLAAKG